MYAFLKVVNIFTSLYIKRVSKSMCVVKLMTPPLLGEIAELLGQQCVNLPLSDPPGALAEK